MPAERGHFVDYHRPGDSEPQVALVIRMYPAFTDGPGHPFVDLVVFDESGILFERFIPFSPVPVPRHYTLLREGVRVA